MPSTPSGGASRTGGGCVPSPGPGRAERDAAVEGRGDVVGVALDPSRVGQQILAGVGQLEEVVGGHQAGDDRRGARAEPAGERDLAADPERDPVGRMEVLEGADDQVAAVGRRLDPLRDDRELAGLGDLELQLERQSGAEDVVAGTEVRRRGRDADDAPALAHRRLPVARREPGRVAADAAGEDAAVGDLRPGQEQRVLDLRARADRGPGADHGGPDDRRSGADPAAVAEEDVPLHLDVTGQLELGRRLAVGERPTEPRQLDQAVDGVEVALQVLGERPDVVPVGVDLVNVERHVGGEQRREDVVGEVDRIGHLVLRACSRRSRG